MPLFGKSNTDKPDLIETVGPVPEGYHAEKLLFENKVTPFGKGVQEEICKSFRKQCVTNSLDGFANLRFSIGGDSSVVLGYADGIKQN